MWVKLFFITAEFSAQECDKEINFRTSMSPCHMRRKQNWNCLFDFCISLSLLPVSFPFFCPVFSFSGYPLGFIKVGIVVGKVFRNAKLFWRGEGELVQQDFSWNFQVNFTCCFCTFFSGLFDWIVLFALHKLGVKVDVEKRSGGPLPLLNKMPARQWNTLFLFSTFSFKVRGHALSCFV